MSGIILIPKADDQHSNYPCWIPTENSKGEKLKPVIVCQCGKHLGMGNHAIQADGKVTASWYHKKGDNYPEDPEGCEWHVFLQLKDWTGEAYPKGYEPNKFE